MSIINELIMNRTQSDVDRLEQIAEEAGKKGFENLPEEDRNYWLRGEMLELRCLDGTLRCTDGELRCREGILRGAYNAADLNRVESAVDYLQEHLNALAMSVKVSEYLISLGVADDVFFQVPYEPLALSAKTDWDMDSIPVLQDMERYLSNVTEVTAAIPIERALPETMDNLTWQGANEIERTLSAEYSASLAWETEKKQYADNTAAAWFYSGDLFCSEI